MVKNNGVIKSRFNQMIFFIILYFIITFIQFFEMLS